MSHEHSTQSSHTRLSSSSAPATGSFDSLGVVQDSNTIVEQFHRGEIDRTDAILKLVTAIPNSTVLNSTGANAFAQYYARLEEEEDRNQSAGRRGGASPSGNIHANVGRRVPESAQTDPAPVSACPEAEPPGTNQQSTTRSLIRGLSPQTDDAAVKRIKIDERFLPWAVNDADAEGRLGESLNQTRLQLAEYQKDPRSVLNSVLNSLHRVSFPESEWLAIIKGHAVNFDKVHSHRLSLSTSYKATRRIAQGLDFIIEDPEPPNKPVPLSSRIDLTSSETTMNGSTTGLRPVKRVFTSESSTSTPNPDLALVAQAKADPGSGPAKVGPAPRGQGQGQQKRAGPGPARPMDSLSLPQGETFPLINHQSSTISKDLTSTSGELGTLPRRNLKRKVSQAGLALPLGCEKYRCLATDTMKTRAVAQTRAHAAATSTSVHDARRLDTLWKNAPSHLISLDPASLRAQLHSTTFDPPLPRPRPCEFRPEILATISSYPDLFKIVTPIKVERLQQLLTTHPNQPFVASVLLGLREGFWPFAHTHPESYPLVHDASD
ncbi:hypothetical protein JOM56_003150 [Amanita muscaria]